jgi:ABC-type branched-subunit amino acid transport system substrate-binding protein
MLKISRDWATPLTIGAFSLMSGTGLLMFFHAETGMNKLAHEWVGLVMVGGVAAHAVANWAAFKRYFLTGALSRGLIALGLLVMAGSFFSPPGGKRLSPPGMAMKAVVSAPLAKVAPLAGRSTEQAIADLAKAGIKVSGGDVSLEKATADNREMQAKAVAVLFSKGK